MTKLKNTLFINMVILFACIAVSLINYKIYLFLLAVFVLSNIYLTRLLNEVDSLRKEIILLNILIIIVLLLPIKSNNIKLVIYSITGIIYYSIIFYKIKKML